MGVVQGLRGDYGCTEFLHWVQEKGERTRSGLKIELTYGHRRAHHTVRSGVNLCSGSVEGQAQSMTRSPVQLTSTLLSGFSGGIACRHFSRWACLSLDPLCHFPAPPSSLLPVKFLHLIYTITHHPELLFTSPRRLQPLMPYFILFLKKYLSLCM